MELEGEALTKRDALNLDGCGCKFVLAEITRLFEQALRGTETSQTQDVMVRFGDLLNENDETLRRHLNLIGAPEMEADDVRALPPVLNGGGWLAASQ